MKRKLDENIPSSVAEFLRELLFDVDTVLEESLGGSDVRTVLEAARAKGRILITLDCGFGDVRAYPPGSHPGIVVFRPDDQRVPTVLCSVESAEARAELEESIRSYSLGEFRRHLSITQEDLAAALHVNQPAVSKLERADDMSLSRLRNAAKHWAANSKSACASMASSSRCSCSNESPPDLPRTIQEILDQQDGLADKFENFDPDLGHERPIEEYLEARRSRIGSQAATDVSSGDLIHRS